MNIVDAERITQFILKVEKERENLRAAIQKWLDYDGDNGDAEFKEIFEEVLKNN